MYEDDPNSYFDYLCSKCGRLGRTHTQLLEQLLRKPFKVKVRMDANRNEDGLALRDGHPDAPGGSRASLLEVLVALAERACFMSDSDDTGWWMREMLDNVGLTWFSDTAYDNNSSAHREVDAIVATLLDRQYEVNGSGGLFPLRNPSGDQTRVELWYQLGQYVTENFDF